MKTDQDMLTDILKTTQMGQVGIRCVMDYAQKDELRSALKAVSYTHLRAHET